MGWTTPWTSQRIVECCRDVLGMVPLSKLMIGSGGHGSPEISWLSVKTAKIVLGEVLTDAVYAWGLFREGCGKDGADDPVR